MAGASGRRRYRAFDLSLESELALPARVELGAPNRPADLCFRKAPLHNIDRVGEVRRVASAIELALISTTHWVVLLHPPQSPYKCSLSIEPNCVEAGWSDAVDEADVAMLLLMKGIAVHSAFTGRVCLHGCAVEDRGGRVHAFLGKSGRGKSTLALAMVAAGGRLISEEIVVLDRHNPTSAVPGAAMLKVSRRAAAHAGYAERGRPAFLATGRPEFVAIDLREDTELVTSSAPIDELYILERRHDGRAPLLSAPLGLADAASLLAASAYWMAHLPSSASALVLKTALHLAQSVPVRLLSMPDRLDILSEAAATLCGSPASVAGP